MLKLLVVILCCGYCVARTSEELKIQLDDGNILGRYLTSDSGRGIRGFMGIPFAEPPIGKLRFKAPLKKKPWKGTLIAQQDAPICTQIDIFTRSSQVGGQEDCLYLNVYTPVVSINN